MKITEEEIKKYGEEYQGLMSRAHDRLDDNHMAINMVNLIKSTEGIETDEKRPIKEQFNVIKESIREFTSFVKVKHEYVSGKWVITDFERVMLDEAEDWRNLTRLVRSLSRSTGGLSS